MRRVSEVFPDQNCVRNLAEATPSFRMAFRSDGGWHTNAGAGISERSGD